MAAGRHDFDEDKSSGSVIGDVEPTPSQQHRPTFQDLEHAKEHVAVEGNIAGNKFARPFQLPLGASRFDPPKSDITL